MGTLVKIKFPEDFEKQHDIYKDKIINSIGGQQKMTTSKADTGLLLNQDKLIISLKDREIWINNYLLSKPHAVGKNMGFFEYIYNNPNISIKRTDLPDSIKKEILRKSFTKIINAIGFKGEILKAFFPKRGKTEFMFKKEVLLKDLNNSGIKTPVLLKELELAHTKNSLK